MPWGEAARVVSSGGLRSGTSVSPAVWPSFRAGLVVVGYHRAAGALRVGCHAPQVMLLDRDPSVTAMACRPVELSWRGSEGSGVSHVPHLMARFSDGGGLLLDCAGRGEISPGSHTVLTSWQRRHVRWDGSTGSPRLPNRLSPPGLAVGYRHPRYRDTALLEEAVQVFARPRPLIEGARDLGDTIRVLPALFHALWTGSLSAPLNEPCMNG
ncbi:TnsA-like heteromeric transposase endonuclease subunit [Streptomyces hawaiiensis]|uniref:Uncharacterized protein n=1 Tax=Streptomyces hawaiiensis TaxID=67305 RepID=A0A6G5RQR2_9ACTN|nr:hypothetical protein CEB94_40845 [Streptomyces hawaiiensis]